VNICDELARLAKNLGFFKKSPHIAHTILYLSIQTHVHIQIFN